MIKRKPIQTLARVLGTLLIIAAITAFYFFIFNQANSITIAMISDTKLRDPALQATAFHDIQMNLSVLPLSLGREPVGSLAIYGASISDTALHAIGNLAAIVMERARAEATATRMEAARTTTSPSRLGNRN